MADENVSISFTICVHSYGNSEKLHRDLAQSLAAALYSKFGASYELWNNEGHRLLYDPQGSVDGVGSGKLSILTD